ncbi:helix-turn-helix transcriptional regulator [Microbacterium sp. 16-032]|uniref:helix-turn-helix domain-containing protein n=1 Tax=Microbacterium sp. 16-032 TaxID=3239808 RepID=UPI0025DD7A11|nr:helix-turn-helix transcriptional regulator [uncultured Microbacterium sp.]
MQATSPGARTHYLSVDPERLDKLRDAHGIPTDAEFARLIGVDDSTLRRVRKGETVASNEFLAKLAAAFPHASFDSLFVLRSSDEARAAEAGK